jgi:DNA-directed RNA polymerase specialized sigma24 family protein
MTLEEIAEAMELSLATVKRALRRASLRVSQLIDSDDLKRRPAGTANRRRS